MRLILDRRVASLQCLTYVPLHNIGIGHPWMLAIVESPDEENSRLAFMQRIGKTNNGFSNFPVVEGGLALNPRVFGLS